MTTAQVFLAADAYMVCLSHALSTEKEEVMGLLIGDIDYNKTANITAVIILRRSDKKKDRVEISPEQLSSATTHAESLTAMLKRPMRVLGWYHSHPHITVNPSHVDINTQGVYQMLDDGFVGLIFSVFSQDKATKPYQIQLTCFQSINQSPEGEPPQYMKHEVPVYVVPTSQLSKPCLDMLFMLPRILYEEEQEAYSIMEHFSSTDTLTELHNQAVFTKSLCNIAEVISGPILQMLEGRITAKDLEIERMKKRKKELMEKLKLQEESKIPIDI